jgi:hypothetical protein
MHVLCICIRLRLRPDWVPGTGARHWCPALVLAPSLNMTLSNEIGHSAQGRALTLEVVLNNGTVLNMFCEPF